MNFSLLVPTRDRHVQRERLLNSIHTTTAYPQNIEILFAVDRDDVRSQDHLKAIIPNYPNLNISYHIRNRSIFLNRDYYNWLSGFASGDFLWVLGDDLVLTYEHWDSFVLGEIQKYLNGKPDRIVCIGLQDNTPKPSQHLPDICCFPMISKEAVHALFLLPPDVPTWGADYVLHHLYARINRLLTIQNKIFLNHVSYHSKQVGIDALGKRMGTIFNQLKMRPEFNTDRMIAEKVPIWAEYLQSIIEKRIRL